MNEIKIPTQTICLVNGKINVGEPCTFLDIKRMIDAYPRNAHREMQAAIDEMLDVLEIEDPAWVPSAIGTFVFVHLCEKAPEDQKDALVKAVLTSLCSGIPDIVLSTCFVSISKGTLWADAKTFATSGFLTDGNLNLQFPSDPNFSKDGAWIGGFPVETKANPELN